MYDAKRNLNQKQNSPSRIAADMENMAIMHSRRINTLIFERRHIQV